MLPGYGDQATWGVDPAKDGENECECLDCDEVFDLDDTENPECPVCGSDNIGVVF